MFPKKVKLIIMVASFRNINMIKKMGFIVYSSKSNRYIVIYVNTDDYDIIINKLKKIGSVKRVSISPLNDLVKTFSQTQDVEDEDDDEI